MLFPPAGLRDRQLRARTMQVVAKADWYVAEAGRFELVGKGDVSEADLRAVYGELRDLGVFVCVPRPPSIEARLGIGKFGLSKTPRRIRQSEKAHDIATAGPKLSWVARGSRVAVLPELGPVWVDDEHLFEPGETVPLPWTYPLVEMKIVRPKTVLACLRAVIGSNGPVRAKLPPST